MTFTMKRTLVPTIATCLLVAPAAMADTHMSDMRSNMHNNMASDAMTTDELMQNQGNLIRSRDITGGEIYTTSAADTDDWTSDTTWDSIDSEWAEIGEIEDLVLTSDGKVTGIVAEVGGFLDIGDKHVMISVQDLNLVAVDDVSYSYVTRLSEEQLEEMEGVDEAFWN